MGSVRYSQSLVIMVMLCPHRFWGVRLGLDSEVLTLQALPCLYIVGSLLARRYLENTRMSPPAAAIWDGSGEVADLNDSSVWVRSGLKPRVFA